MDGALDRLLADQVAEQPADGALDRFLAEQVAEQSAEQSAERLAQRATAQRKGAIRWPADWCPAGLATLDLMDTLWDAPSYVMACLRDATYYMAASIWSNL